MMQSERSVASSVVFRPPTPRDFDVLAEIRRDVRMQSLLMSIPEHTDDAAVRDWIDRRVNEPGGMFRVIALAPEDAAVGFIQISGVDAHHRHGYGAVAILERCEAPGVAMLAMRELARCGRVELGVRTFMAEIRADNTVALRMNRMMGYKVIGTLEQHFVDHDGNRHDVILLQKTL